VCVSVLHVRTAHRALASLSSGERGVFPLQARDERRADIGLKMMCRDAVDGDEGLVPALARPRQEPLFQ